MRSKVESYDDAVFQAENTGLVADFKQRFKWSPVAPLKNFQTFVTERDSPTLTTAFDNTMTGGFPEPTAEAIESLKINPDKAADFDDLFGKGAAAKILGNN
jgi:hypothetical protein